MSIPARLLVTLSLTLGLNQPAKAQNAPQVPSKLECWTVTKLHKHYSKKGYTVDQMKGYLRSLGFSEPKIAKAEKCLD